MTIDAFVREIQSGAVTVEERPQRIPRKALAGVRPTPDVEDR
ncbi:MAG TPA: hypothetical protein VFF43_02275 [Caldimonas sp.]|nr:hypothetical protein [Caldimonas sp.]